MANVDIKVNLITKAAELQLQQLGRTAQATSNTFTKFSGNVKGFGTDFDTAFRQGSLALGRFGTVIRAGVVGAGLFGLIGTIKKTVNEFAAFETALIGVGKTTDLPTESLNAFGQSIVNLSLKIPASANELLNLAQIAAQLGVRGTKNLEKFAEVGIRLGVSTNVGAEEAVTALSRIIGITGESITNVDNLGSALVFLGNNFKTSESDILSAARRISQSTAGFGLLGDQILGIAAALKEAGVQSESGGTAIGRVFREIDKAVTSGGTKLETFLRVTGLTADELKEKLATDAAGTFKIFIQGLDNSVKSGENLTQTLVDLGLSNDRVQATLRPLVSISGQVTRAIDGSTKAAKENKALYEESGKVFTTVNGQLEILSNTLLSIFTGIGQANKGVIKDFISGLTTIAGVISRALNQDVSLAKQIEDADNALKKAKLQLEIYNNQAELLPDYLKDSTDEIIKHGTLLGNVASAQKIVNELKKQQGTIEDENNQKIKPKGTPTFDPANDAAILEETQRLEFLKNLRDIDAEEQKLNLDNLNALLIGAGDARLELIAKQLGEEEALKVAGRAKELTDVGKHEQAKKVIKDAADKAEKDRAAAQIQLEQQTGQQRANIVGNIGQLINTIAGRETKAGFLLQKAAAAAQIIIQGQIAQAKALAAFPITAGEPLVSLIRANTGIQLATVAASAIAGFQDGGIIPGNNTSGDRVLARVNSGEMILNRQQQAQLFAQANGRGAAGTSESVTNITVELDGDIVAKAVSRRVNDGTELGSLI